MDIRYIVQEMIKRYEKNDTEFLYITFHKDGSGSVYHETLDVPYGKIELSFNSLQEFIHQFNSPVEKDNPKTVDVNEVRY